MECQKQKLHKILCKNRKNTNTIWNHKRFQIAKKSWGGKNDAKNDPFYGFQNILQKYSNKTNMILTQKGPYKPMEQTKRHNHEYTSLLTSDIWQRCQQHTLEARLHLQQIMMGKLDVHMQKNKIRPETITLHKS